MNDGLLLEADINSIKEETVQHEGFDITRQNYTLACVSEPSFEEVKTLMSDRPLHPIDRPRLAM